MGLAKPDTAIFKKCTQALDVSPEECLYIGDGGSFELETARSIGMHPIQAVWYLKEGANQPAKRKNDFIQAESPMSVISQIEKFS